MAGVAAEDVDLVLLATSTPDDIFGSACTVYTTPPSRWPQRVACAGSHRRNTIHHSMPHMPLALHACIPCRNGMNTHHPSSVSACALVDGAEPAVGALGRFCNQLWASHRAVYGHYRAVYAHLPSTLVTPTRQ
jgi:hypothetical protein